MSDLWATDKKVTPLCRGLASALELAAINPKRRRRTVTGTLELIDLTTGVSAERDEVLAFRLKQYGKFFPGKWVSVADAKVKDYSGGSWFKPLALAVDSLNNSVRSPFVAIGERAEAADRSRPGNR